MIIIIISWLCRHLFAVPSRVFIVHLKSMAHVFQIDRMEKTDMYKNLNSICCLSMLWNSYGIPNSLVLISKILRTSSLLISLKCVWLFEKPRQKPHILLTQSHSSPGKERKKIYINKHFILWLPNKRKI